MVLPVIPLHVIKIIQSPSSPLRVQLWWPSFNIPREDLRHYLRRALGPLQAMRTPEEAFLNPYARGTGSRNSQFALPGIFVEIKYRTIAGDMTLLCH